MGGNRGFASRGSGSYGSLDFLRHLLHLNHGHFNARGSVPGCIVLHPDHMFSFPFPDLITFTINPKGPSGTLLSSSRTLVCGKGLMAGEATSSYKWHVLECPYLASSSRKAASVAVLSLQAAAFMTQGTMSNWYMSPEGHGFSKKWPAVILPLCLQIMTTYQGP